MKRILALILAATCLLALCATGGVYDLVLNTDGMVVLKAK